MRLDSTLRRLRDEEGDTYLLALVRIGFGLLLLNEAWLATTQLRDAGYFGGYFHQSFLPDGLVPSVGVYQGVLGVQFVAAALVVAGRAARSALLVAAALLVYVMLCDRLWFHHYVTPWRPSRRFSPSRRVTGNWSSVGPCGSPRGQSGRRARSARRSP